ncbi:hypothetical protein PRIPAC_83661, partial [Pristionchus pacificus]
LIFPLIRPLLLIDMTWVVSILPLLSLISSCLGQSSIIPSPFSVFRLTPSSPYQKAAIELLYKNASMLNLDFWKTSHDGSRFWDVMVGEREQSTLLSILDRANISFEKTIDDVEKLIKTREHSPRKMSFSRRLKDDSVSSSGYDFRRYSSYPAMQKWMRNLARDYPHLVQLTSIGLTHEGRSIDGIEIGLNRETSRVFWIDAGIHAREWAAPHTALYFIHQLTSRWEDPEMRKMLETITFVILPCVNPDGYEFTRSSTNPHIRLWRKNRSEMICRNDHWGRRRCCRGVDLNRNFDFHFKESGSSDDPCSEIYQGKTAFSEPETRAIRDAVLSRRYRDRMDGFITLHTYSQIWIHSYGHKKEAYPGDIDDLYKVAKRATAALEAMYGTKYIVGSGADTLYPASGGSEDWVKQTTHVKYVYLIELRPEEKNWDGFILDERELLPTARETWAGIRVVAEAILDRKAQMDNQKLPGRCVNVKLSCARWLRERPQLCTQVPLFMKENCALACGIC